MSPHTWYRRVLGGYRVGGHIGDALGGQLYEGQELAGSRSLLIELIDASVAGAPGFARRFERDIALLGSIAHPHIVMLHGAGRAEGVTYLALDPLDGHTLGELVSASGRLDPARVTELAAQLAAALDAAHQRGLVHRGLSPASIVVRERGGVEQAAIMDFAVADDTSMYGGMFERPAGAAPPPIGYAAPEQVRGEPTGPRTDVYALGAILFHALAARPPFTGLTARATLEAHLHEPVPSACALVADLPAGFDEVFARALAKDPEERYASASELAGALPSTRPALASTRPALASTRSTVARPAAIDAAVGTRVRSGTPGAAAYHFLRARAYDPPVGTVNYGPEEPGVDDLLDADVDAPAALARFGAGAVVDGAGASDLDEYDDFDLDDYEELPEDVDLEGFEADGELAPFFVPREAWLSPRGGGEDEGVRADDAPTAGLDVPWTAASAADEGPNVTGSSGVADVTRSEPALARIDPRVHPPRTRRRRGRRTGALLIAAGLLLAAIASVLAIAGVFDDGDGPGAGTTSSPTIGQAANSQADALARLRRAAKTTASGGTTSSGSPTGSGAGSASGATTTGAGSATGATATGSGGGSGSAP